MISTVTCQHCGNAFEAEIVDKTEFCPHCGKETSVQFIPAKAAQPAPTTPAIPVPVDGFKFLATRMSVHAGFVVIFLGIIAGLQIASYRNQTRPEQPTKWDYAIFPWKEAKYDWDAKTVTRTGIKFSSGWHASVYTNGTAYYGLGSALDDLGDYGWEVAMDAPEGIILKRPKDRKQDASFVVFHITEALKTK